MPFGIILYKVTILSVVQVSELSMVKDKPEDLVPEQHHFPISPMPEFCR